MFDIGRDDDAATRFPALVPATGGNLSVERQYELNGVMGVPRHDPVGASHGEESAVPDVPAHRVRNLHARAGFFAKGVGRVGHREVSPAIASLFKTISGIVQGNRLRRTSGNPVLPLSSGPFAAMPRRQPPEYA